MPRLSRKNGPAPLPRTRCRGVYSAVARGLGVSRQYVWQVVHGERKDERISRAIEREQARRLQPPAGGEHGQLP